MRSTVLFFLYLFLCLAVAAMLTYPAMQTGWLDFPPQRVMSRLAQVLILLGIWPLLKALALNDRLSLGYGVTGAELRRAVVRGWLLGLLILIALALALYLLGVRVPDAAGIHWPDLVNKAIQALIGGLLIGVLEETFFRGALFAAIRRREGVAAAVIWSALLYALVHFLKPGALPAGAVFDWGGALSMFIAVFTDAFQWKNLDSMIALFMVGVFLALVRERAGHIGWCIGLHAGWVFVIQVTRRLTDGDASSPLAFLAGDYDGMIGWLSAAWIGALALGYWGWSMRRARPVSDRA